MGLVDRVATLGDLLQETGAGESVSQAESLVLRDELCHAWESGVWRPLIDMEAIRRRERVQALLRRE